MTCVHRVRWSVKRPEDCRFRLSVSHYKDRIVAPDEYSGATVITPSDSEQVLPTKDKLVRDDITVLPAPTEYLSTDHNGTFTPSDGKVGFSSVSVDVPIPTFETEEKTITLNGNYSAEDDSVDGYSEVTVNVQNGATMTEVANTYGTGVVITSAQGAEPSATRHTILFEFEDETSTTIYAYYDSSFVGNAITATTPATYDSKTVTSAQLDGVEWYSYTPVPVGPTYDTIFDDDITVGSGGIAIASLSDLYFAEGETWRVTWAGTEYICQTQIYEGWLWTIGNQNIPKGTDDGTTGEPFCLYNYGGGAMNGNAREAGTVHLKLERQVSA